VILDQNVIEYKDIFVNYNCNIIDGDVIILQIGFQSIKQKYLAHLFDDKSSMLEQYNWKEILTIPDFYVHCSNSHHHWYVEQHLKEPLDHNTNIMFSDELEH